MATARGTSKVHRGVRYRSLFEVSIARHLEGLGVAYDYESCTIPYTLECVYTPDFTLPNGIHIEAKGLFDPADRRKAKAVRKQNPDLDIRFVFQRPKAKISKGSRTTYAKWCEQHGFMWADRMIPPAWIMEPKKG